MKKKLAKRGLTSLAALPRPAAIEELDLSGNALTSLRDLPAMPTLHTLNLIRNPLRTLDGIENAPALRRLYVDVKDPSAVTRLRSLEVLMVSTPAKDLRWAKLPALDYLGISGPLRSLAGLEQLAALGELVIHNAKLAKRDALAHHSLWKLIIVGCELRAIPALDTPALMILHVHQNNIAAISGLEGAQGVENLTLYGNPLTELRGLEYLRKLELLAIDGRKIKTISAATHRHLLTLDALRLRTPGKGTPYAPFAAKKRIVE